MNRRAEKEEKEAGATIPFFNFLSVERLVLCHSMQLNIPEHLNCTSDHRPFRPTIITPVFNGLSTVNGPFEVGEG
jgi:hypothetical protein